MDDIEYWSNEFEKTKRFLELCSPEVHDYVTRQVGLYIKAHPSSPLTKERQDLWDQFIASNPILQRVIYYTYSPVDAIGLRYDEMRSATDINLANDGCYIDFALNDSYFPDDALLRDFIEKMKFDMDRVSAADNWKREGAKEPIEELRRTCFYSKTWEDGDGCKITKVIIDQSFSDGYRDELIAKRHPDGTITEEYHTHILSKDEPDTSRFIDETLARWMQLFEDDEELRESAFYSDDHVYVHNSAGEVVEKIPFGMANKYRPLIKATHRKHPLEREAYWLTKKGEPVRDQIDRHWDLEQIFRDIILNWDEKKPIAAYFKYALKYGFLNLEKRFRERFITNKDNLIGCKQCGLYFPLSESKGGEDCPWCENPIDPQNLAKEIKTHFLKEDLDFEGGSLDELVEGEDGEAVRMLDLLQGKAGASPMGFDPLNLKTFSIRLDYKDIMMELEDRVGGVEFSRLIDLFNDPVSRVLLLDEYDVFCRNLKPTSHAKMSRLLKERGIKMSPQRIGQRRKKLRLALEKLFSSNS
jgi:hypothetical protein